MPGKGDIASLLARQHMEFNSDAGRGWTQAANVLNSTMDRVEAQKRYEAEKAQKDLLFQQAQEDRAQAKAIRQGILDTEQAKAMAAPYAKDVVAFNDPRYAKALEQWKAQGNTDITESDKILANYLGGTQQPPIVSQGVGIPNIGKGLNAADGSAQEFSAGTRNYPIGNGTKTVTHTTPGKPGYVDPNATVKFGDSQLVTTKPVEKPYSLLEAFTGRDDRIERQGSSRLNNQVASINAKYDELLKPYQETLRNTSVMATGFTNNPSFNEA